MMTMFRSEFQKAIADSIGATTKYSTLTEDVAVTKDSFHLNGYDCVSLLTDADVSDVTMERIDGIDFLADLPNEYSSEENIPCDLKPYKQTDAGSVLKVTVNVLPETYSGSKDAGGSAHIGKIWSNYGGKITDAMNKVYSFNEGVLESEGDIASTAAVTYYFDAQTLAPLTAVYHIVMDSNQKINVYSKEEDVGKTSPAGYVKVEIINMTDAYYFFDK